MKIESNKKNFNAGMMKLVDISDLGSDEFVRGGSNPSTRRSTLFNGLDLSNFSFFYGCVA